MSTSRNESLTTAWNRTRDVVFFRITAHVFSPQFCLGASVLLATYDDEPVATRFLPPASQAAPVAADQRGYLPVRPARGEGG